MKINLLQKNINNDDLIEPDAKKMKKNVCVACYDLFEFMDELVMKVKSSELLDHYEVKRFVTTYSLPVSLDLAQLQLWLALLEKFPDSFETGKILEKIDSIKHHEHIKASFHRPPSRHANQGCCQEHSKHEAIG